MILQCISQINNPPLPCVPPPTSSLLSPTSSSLPSHLFSSHLLPLPPPPRPSHFFPLPPPPPLSHPPCCPPTHSWFPCSTLFLLSSASCLSMSSTQREIIASIIGACREKILILLETFLSSPLPTSMTESNSSQREL